MLIQPQLKLLWKTQLNYLLTFNRSQCATILFRRDLEKRINAFVSTHLDYCDSLWLGNPPRGHVPPTLASLHWLHANYTVYLKLLVLVCVYLSNVAPSYLSDQPQPHCPATSMRSARSPKNRAEAQRRQSTFLGYFLRKQLFVCFVLFLYFCLHVHLHVPHFGYPCVFF